MRLLLDQNQSPRLKEKLKDLYPDSIHVRDAGFESAGDVSVWTFAREREYAIASKDADFRQLSFAFGHPPKTVWIRRGNCSTLEIESIQRDRYNDLLTFYQDEEGSFFALS